MKKLLLLSLAISTATMAITKEDATSMYNSLNENLNNHLTKLRTNCPTNVFESSSTADIPQECMDALDQVRKDTTPNPQTCDPSTGKKSTYEFLTGLHFGTDADDPLSHLNAGNALAAVLGLAALAAAYKYDVYGKMYRMAFGGDTPKEKQLSDTVSIVSSGANNQSDQSDGSEDEGENRTQQNQRLNAKKTVKPVSKQPMMRGRPVLFY